MEKYKAFSVSNIHPQDNSYNANKSVVMHIPEPVSYDTRERALNSEIRWDYSFGIEQNEVVILIRHITIIDAQYRKIRSMPEYYYDYKTFVKLGGWIDCITKKENVVNTVRLNKDFNCLYPNLLHDTKLEIHINPSGIKTYKCSNDDIQIPMPIHNIVQNYIPKGNYNCGRPLVDNSFFKALSAFDTADINGKTCHITKDYVSVDDFNSENSKSLIYDNRMQKVVNEKEWENCCYDYTITQEREKIRALKKQGLLDAYNSLEAYLNNCHSLRAIDGIINQDGFFQNKIIERDLTYGYKLTGFELLQDAVIWHITTYERPIKQNDCIRGMDDCYLMFKNGIITEVARHHSGYVPITDYTEMRPKHCPKCRTKLKY